MDGLMSEATAFILSGGNNLALGSDKVLKWETIESSESPADSSSITLLRLSITNSIRNRSVDSEVSDVNVSKSKKNKRFKETNTQSTKIKFITNNSDTSVADECGQKESNFTVKAFCELLKDRDATEKDSPSCTPETQSLKTDHPQTNELNEEQRGRNKTGQNSMKLASRNFTDNIFENCSTYNLACDETHQEKIAETSPELADSPVASNFSEKNPKGIGDVNPNGTAADKNSCTDDDMNLRDSFFVDLTSDGDLQSSDSRLDKVPENFIQSKKSSRNSLPGEDGAFTEGKGEEIQQRCERRLSKKLRKRNRKSKSSNVPTYECSKCGVFYLLSAKASERTARCLHCDLWTSVEPEFLKIEKQPWNTCRIC